MFIAGSSKTPPAPFGGAETILNSNYEVHFRSSERRVPVDRREAINIRLLRSEATQ